MKNKAAVYLLGLLVLVVWGMIIYRVVGASSGDDGAGTSSPVPHYSKAPMNDYALKKDTASLRLNYSDPFALPAMAKAKKDTTQIPVARLLHGGARPQGASLGTSKPAPMNWTFIRYAGYIRNPKSKKLLALLTISGRSVTLAEGESDGGVRLLKNLRDSIKITYQNKVHFTTLNAATP
jgi:hypothetical protein